MENLPKHLAVLYQAQTAPRRGPRPALKLEAVVAAAMEIADAEGLGTLSMSRVAERLGFTTMSLYRHVRSKDDLLLLMANAASADPPPPPPTPDAWRAGLEAWSRALFATYRRHPWLLRVPMSGPPLGPAQLAWMEAALANLAATGLHEGEKLQIASVLHGYARGEAQLSADLVEETGHGFGDVLRMVTSPETHPALTRLLASGVADGPTGYDEEYDLGFGLRTILDGVERLVTRSA